MKLKNSNCDETQKGKLQWNSKNVIVMKLKNSNDDETKNSKWQNSKTQIVIKLKNSNCDKIKIVTKLKNSKGFNVIFIF